MRGQRNKGAFVLHLQRRVIPPKRKAMHDDFRWDEEVMSQLKLWTSVGGGNDDSCWCCRYCWCSFYCSYGDVVVTAGTADGTALGNKLIDALDGYTICVDVGAALGKLVDQSNKVVFMNLID